MARNNVAVLPIFRDSNDEFWVYLPIERKKWVGQTVVDCLTTFGGGVCQGENSSLAAARELNEESLGIFGDMQKVHSQLIDSKVVTRFAYTEECHTHDIRYNGLQIRTDMFLIPVALPTAQNIDIGQVGRKIRDFFLDKFNIKRNQSQAFSSETTEVQKIAKVKVSDLENLFKNNGDDNQTICVIDSNSNEVRLPLVNYVFKSFKCLFDKGVFLQFIQPKTFTTKEYELNGKNYLTFKQQLQQELEIINKKIKLIQDSLLQKNITQELIIYYEGSLQRSKKKQQELKQQIQQIEHPTVNQQPSLPKKRSLSFMLGVNLDKENNNSDTKRSNSVSSRVDVRDYVTIQDDEIDRRRSLIQLELEKNNAKIKAIQTNLAREDIDNELRKYYETSLQRNQQEKQRLEFQIQKATANNNIQTANNTNPEVVEIELQRSNDTAAGKLQQYQKELRSIKDRIKKIRISLMPVLHEQEDNLIKEINKLPKSANLQIVLLTEKVNLLKAQRKELGEDFISLNKQKNDLIARFKANNSFVEDMAISTELKADGKCWYSAKQNLHQVVSILKNGITKNSLTEDQGRFGISEYGPGVYLSKNHVPYAVQGQYVMVFKLAEDLEGGVLIDPVTKMLRLHANKQREVTKGYDKILLGHNFLQHGALVVGDAEEINLRSAQCKMIPVGIYEPRNIVFNNINDEIDFNRSKMTPIGEFCVQNQLELSHEFKPRVVRYLDPNQYTCELRDPVNPNQRIFFKKLRGEFNAPVYAEICASNLASYLIGSEKLVPPAKEMSLNGCKGIAQPLINFRSFTTCALNSSGAIDFTQFSQKQRDQFFAHMLVNWVISNHDVHAGNWGIDNEGNIVSFDKGQSFKEFIGSKISSQWALNNKHFGFGAERSFVNGNGKFYQVQVDNLFNVQKQFLNQMLKHEISVNYDSPIIQETLHKIETLTTGLVATHMKQYAEIQFSSKECCFYDSIIDRASKIRQQIEELSRLTVGNSPKITRRRGGVITI